MKVNIYCLKDPITGIVHYVGRTRRTLAVRLGQHISTAQAGEGSPKAIWIREAIQNGKQPAIELIEQCSEDQAKEREAHWIQSYLSLNAELLNQRLRKEGAAATKDAHKGFFVGAHLEEVHINKLKEVQERLRKLIGNDATTSKTLRYIVQNFDESLLLTL